MHDVEADLVQQVQRVLELRLRLAAEADDHIRRERDAGPPRAQPVDQPAVLRQRVATAHPLEHAIVAVLHGNVDMLADLGQPCHLADHLIGHVARIRGHEADAHQPGDLAEPLHQVGEVTVAGQIQPVGLEGLAEPRELGGAGGHEVARLDQQLFQRAAALDPTPRGHDAIGADLVAAQHDRQESRWAAGTHADLLRRRIVQVASGRARDDLHGRPLPSARRAPSPTPFPASEERGRIVIREAGRWDRGWRQWRHREDREGAALADGARRAQLGEVYAALAGQRRPALFEELRPDVRFFDLEEEVHDRVAPLEVVDGALVADHAAHHGDQQILAVALGVGEQRQLAVRFLCGLLADATRVEHDEVGGFERGDLFPAESVQDAGDPLRVGLVHLAADGPDMVSAVGDAHARPTFPADAEETSLPAPLRRGAGCRAPAVASGIPLRRRGTLGPATVSVTCCVWTSASSAISSGRTSRTCSFGMRSMKRMPSRWSISCCRTRANQPSAFTRISLPLGSRPLTVTAALRGTSSPTKPGMLRQPSVPSRISSLRLRISGLMRATCSSLYSATSTRSDSPICGPARPTPSALRMVSHMPLTSFSIWGSKRETFWALARRTGWSRVRILRTAIR